MSKYTTEVRFICETYAGLDESVGYEKVDEIISKARAKVFDFDYPIFDEAYRAVLEKKILVHYYTREICEETVALWKLRLRAKMNEIMPYYNKLYESELMDFNPLYDADYHRDGNRDRNEDNTRTNNLTRNTVNGGQDSRTGTSTDGGQDVRVGSAERGGRDSTSTTTRDKYSEWDLYSDTPQGGIEGILGAEDEPSLEDNGYLTNARHILHDGDGTTGNSTTNYGGTTDTTDRTTYGKTNTNTGTTTYGGTSRTTDTGDTSFNGDTTEEYAEHVYGKFPGKSASKLLQEFRETFLNIDMDVIEELKNLFFNLW